LSYKKFFFLLIFFPSCLFPQPEEVIKKDFYTFLSTGQQIAVSPLNLDESDIINIGSFAFLLSSGFLLDNEARTFALENRSEFNKNLFNIDRYYYIESSVALTAGTYLYGFLTEDEEIRQLGLDLGEAAFYSGTLNILIKYISGRYRPYETDDNTKFEPFERMPRYSAFGSAHTTLAFAISTVMADQMDNIFWKAGWYTAAGLVGAARIYHRMHWLSDVMLGASLGHFIGSFVLKKNTGTDITITPLGVGMRVQL